MATVAPRSARGGGGARRVAGGVLLGVVALALGVLTWPLGRPEPFPGVDGSWGAALHLAARDGLDFGPQALFTYGPLGFLDVPRLWGSATGVAAIAFAWGQIAALVCVATLVLRPAVGWLAGFLVGEVLVLLCQPPLLPALAFAAAARLLARPSQGRQAVGWSVALGAVGALELLVKLNSGVLVLAVGAIAVVAHPERRRLVAAFGGTAIGSAALLWIVAGQSFDALPDYLQGSAAIVGGYSEAMGLEAAGAGWQYLLVAALVVAGLGGVAGVTRSSPGATRLGLAAMWCVFSFLAFKSGFVRHDAAHASVFTSLAAVALICLPWRPGTARLAVPVVLVGIVTAALGGRDASPDLGDRPSAGWAAVRAVFDPGERERVEALAAFRIVLTTGISGPLLQQAARMPSAAVWPTESSLAWAGGLRFRPLPDFQDYQAYTDALDRRDADALADDATAPAGVLTSDRPQQLVDGRPTAFNTPRTTRALICHYAQAGSSPGWALLRRVPDRCTTPPRDLGTVRVPAGRAVAIPAPSAPDMVVLVAVDGMAVTGGERVRSFLLRARVRTLTLDGRPGRLVPGTAATGAPVRAGAAVDSAGELVTRARTIAARRGRDDGPVTYRFSEQRVGRVGR